MVVKNKTEIIQKLHSENGNRWMGKPEYSCLTCSHSMSTENNELMCVANPLHKQVAEDNVCEDWI